jgi:hypothetical protein
VALIYDIGVRRDADFLVNMATSAGRADLLVKLVDSSEAAVGDELWHFVHSKDAATSVVHFMLSNYSADLLIYYVDSPGDAGWQREHELQGKL